MDIVTPVLDLVAPYGIAGYATLGAVLGCTWLMLILFTSQPGRGSMRSGQSTFTSSPARDTLGPPGGQEGPLR